MEQFMLLPLVLVSTLFFSCYAQTTAESAGGRVSTTPESFKLTLAHVESYTNSIAIKWQVPNNYTLTNYYIEARKKESDGSMRFDNPTNTSTYVINDLMTNSKYDVCIVADEIQSALEQKSMQDYEECINTFTIPVMRLDSIIALIVVFAFLALLVLIGYCCWRRAHRLQEAEANAKEDEIQPTKANGDQSQPILLVSPPGDKPRSGIEDSDIPYITPTWDELARERKVAAEK